MRRRLWILAVWLVVLLLAAQGCGQPTPAESTATPVLPTDAPTEDLAPTEEPTVTQEPTATAVADRPTAPPTEEPERTPEPVEADGEVLLEERCVDCHGLGRVTDVQKSREGWESTVERMVGYGARLTEDETSVLIDYLVAAYGE